jgi:predicted RNase H-like HicB family nuclease
MAKEAISGYIDLLKEQSQDVPDDNRRLEYALTIAS